MNFKGIKLNATQLSLLFNPTKEGRSESQRIYLAGFAFMAAAVLIQVIACILLKDIHAMYNTYHAGQYVANPASIGSIGLIVAYFLTSIGAGTLQIPVHRMTFWNIVMIFVFYASIGLVATWGWSFIAQSGNFFAYPALVAVGYLVPFVYYQFTGYYSRQAETLALLETAIQAKANYIKNLNEMKNEIQKHLQD